MFRFEDWFEKQIFMNLKGKRIKVMFFKLRKKMRKWRDLRWKFIKINKWYDEFDKLRKIVFDKK